MKKIVRLISLLLDRFPSLRRIKDSVLLFMYKQVYRLRKKEKGLTVDGDCQVIETSRVSGLLGEDVPVLNSFGKKKGGEWDFAVISIYETDTYIALKDHFVSGKAWCELEYYSRVCREVTDGQVRWGCKTIDQVQYRFDSIDSLYESIKLKGILPAAGVSDKSSSFLDDILVCIGRNGQYILHDGMHRFVVALLLNIKKIPVRVTFRHQNWEKFCDDVRAYAVFHNKLYAPILHPELAMIPADHGHERFDAIKRHLPLESGRVLDIGSHWGYFCHQLEPLGFECTALEPDAKNLYFLNALKNTERMNFQVLKHGLFDVDVGGQYDIILALYVFHHFLKLETDYSQLVNFLGKLNAKVMFFAAHSPDEPQMKSAFKNFSSDDFSDFIINNSCFTKKQSIWADEDSGRQLYKLT